MSEVKCFIENDFGNGPIYNDDDDGNALKPEKTSWITHAIILLDSIFKSGKNCYLQNIKEETII